MESSPFLIVEDDVSVAKAMARMLQPIRPVRLAHSAAAALALVDSDQQWCGFVFDVSLEDGSGLDVLQAARARHPLVPALITTGHNEREHINRALVLRAWYACKPVDENEVLPFAYRAVAQDSTGDERIASAIEFAVQHYRLSRREAEIMLDVIAGTPREETLARMNVSRNTFKTQVRSLLQKTNSEDLDELAQRLLRAVVIGPNTAPSALRLRQTASAGESKRSG